MAPKLTMTFILKWLSQCKFINFLLTFFDCNNYCFSLLRALSDLHHDVDQEPQLHFECHNYPLVIKANLVEGKIPEYFLLRDNHDKEDELSPIRRREPYTKYNTARKFISVIGL